jgi:aminoglycoside phosphotransferase (APT) family kinase protein
VDEFQFGPFDSVAAFHSYLLSRVRPQHREELMKAAEGVLAKPHAVYFTHGDLNLRNILFEDGQVTGIVDWTCAGWYPAYWELGKAVYVHQRFQKWRDLWATILPGHEEDLQLEVQMWNASSY